MKKNDNDIILKFKDYSKIKIDKLNEETLKSTISDINIVLNKIKMLQSKIIKCKNIDELNNIDIRPISNDLGLIIQNSIVIEDQETKKSIEEINQSYRNLEILYFNKKIDLVNNVINKTAADTEQNLKDITGGTLFSIASVFLGISLTSALVAGVQKINDSFIILYFMTCLLIAVITIGTAAIFMRKFDKKTVVIIIVIVLVSALWGNIAYLTYEKQNSELTQKDNICTKKETNENKEISKNSQDIE